MFRLTRREQAIIVGFLVLILGVSGIYMYERPSIATEVPLPKFEGQTQTPGTAQTKQDSPQSQSKPASEIKVDVKGAVQNPGVYSLSAGSRIVDAIQVAGGVTDEADLQSINLAQKLVDGGMVAVPAKGDSSSAAQAVPAKSDKVNINTATVEQLDTVNGIGSTRAQAIVQYREKNGPYQSVEDLLKIKGFGPKLLETLKDQLVAY
ncbi:ComEA family DNA-binding protein [Effusibacillus lacus]|uniref:Transporter n=1 Tax=Effusibacillus lacus TaxID=1348429 RepID=A0A292YKD0_9BACL|nr:ComEA family DNA-binding protein [Effusibacillus lacus]TCS72861.1 competence protein ComEA [Effusibacillus lacus]GAX89213.1 transporter [Effusibacillus lacus]